MKGTNSIIPRCNDCGAGTEQATMKDIGRKILRVVRRTLFEEGTSKFKLKMRNSHAKKEQRNI
jgi:hypothetical protein